jgi:pyruvate dehydrogenase E1 component beta subunit/2-oxoisovalerate dehydrogenase E1 component
MSEAHALPGVLEGTQGPALLREMLRIRRFEEKCAALYGESKIRGFLHLYVGEEAVAVGVLRAATSEDAIVATYREHGHALARGVPMGAILAEMYGKVEGCSRGRGGSMHLFDAERRFYGGNAIVGGGLPVAVGLALADRLAGRSRLTFCFFGEGAVAEGEFHESLNLAALWRLPVLFCCENNLYAMGTALGRSESETDLCLKAASYAMPAWPVDGMDVLAVEEAARRAALAVRAGGGPAFLELRTYRFRAHSMFDPQLYRDKQEIEAWMQRDPVRRFEARLREAGLADDERLAALTREVDAEIADAVAFAEAGGLEPVEQLERFVGAERRPPALPREPVPAAGRLRTLSYREAAREALREALARDERVFLMGEDVGAYGGCYAVSQGLLAEFGPERVRDAPLSESAFVGAGIGAALGGLRPIVEVMTVNFSLLALDQIVNNAATLLHMSGGQLHVPIVLRMVTGAGRQLAAQHSHSLEGWFAHVPGLRILAPATLADARGMLWSALQDPDPVLLFEHNGLYAMKGDLAEDAGPVPIDGAAVRRPGRDLTLIAYGGLLPRALEAATRLEDEGVEAEVIDLRVLRPLDAETLLASVARTHRALIVDEGWRSGSLSAEIAARIQERAFFELDAPIARLCTREVPIPYARHLEEAAIPQTADIVARARELVGAR